jgi:hypothetical protein
MKALWIALVFAGFAVSVPADGPINPVGAFAVTTSTDDGDLVTGTLTIRAEGGGYVGVFESKTLGKVPVTDIATSGTHMLGIFNFDDGKAVLDLRLDADGAFTGTWYRFGDGLPVTVIRR